MTAKEPPVMLPVLSGVLTVRLTEPDSVVAA